MQGEATINFQIECLRKRALRYESQISEMTIKHDEEMKEKDIVNDKQRKDLLDERKKRKDLEKELREYDDKLMSGSISTTTNNRGNTPESSPELPQSKRSKIVNVDSTKRVKVDDKGSVKSEAVMTTAYTASKRDKANLLTITKNPLSMTPTDKRSSPVVSANVNVTMRSAAPSTKDSSKLLVLTRNPAPITGFKDPPVSRNPAPMTELNDPPMYSPEEITAPVRSSGGEPIVSASQRQEALTIWKNLLLKTKDYEPALQKSTAMHDENLRFLCNAMRGFRESRLRGMQALQWEHGQFGPL